MELLQVHRGAFDLLLWGRFQLRIFVMRWHPAVHIQFLLLHIRHQKSEAHSLAFSIDQVCKCIARQQRCLLLICYLNTSTLEWGVCCIYWTVLFLFGFYWVGWRVGVLYTREELQDIKYKLCIRCFWTCIIFPAFDLQSVTWSGGTFGRIALTLKNIESSAFDL